MEDIQSLIDELTDYKTVSDNKVSEIMSEVKSTSELTFDDRIMVERNDAARKLFKYIIKRLNSIKYESK
jgi:hypothetical protein